MRGAFVLGVIAGLAAACSPDPTGGSVDGAKIYDGMCTSCHGPTGHPSEQMIQQLNVRDLTSPELRAKATPEFVEAQVRRGSTNKLMPSFQGALTEDQIKAVSAYVASPAFLKRSK